MKKKKGKKKMWIILGCVAGFLLLQWLFIGYRFSFGPFKALGDIRMAKLPGNAESYGMDRLDAMEGSPLEGKKILFLGSSVTYGAASLREGIPEYFAVRLGAEVTKEAVSGTTLTDDSNSSYVHRLLTKVDPATPYSLVVVQLEQGRLQHQDRDRRDRVYHRLFPGDLELPRRVLYGEPL